MLDDNVSYSKAANLKCICTTGIVAAASCLFFYGCMTLAYWITPGEMTLYAQARYGELVQHMEEKVDRMEDAPIQHINYLCEGYAKTKDYKKLFWCLDHMEKRIESGDEIGTWGIGGFDWDYSAAPYLLSAEAFIDLGKYEKAIEQANKSYKKALRNHPNGLMPDDTNTLHYEVLALGYLGLAYALLGDNKTTEIVIEKLEKIQMELPYDHWIKSNKNMALAKIYMALGEYQKGLEVIHRFRGKDKIDSFAVNVLLAEGLIKGGMDIYLHFTALPREYFAYKLLLETGRVEAAKKGFDELLTKKALSTIREIYWMVLFDRGRIAEKENDVNHALNLYQQAVEVIEQQRSSISTEVSKIGFVRDKQTVYQRVVNILFEKKRGDAPGNVENRIR